MLQDTVGMFRSFIQVPRVYRWSVDWVGAVRWCASEARRSGEAGADCSKNLQSGPQCRSRRHIISEQGTCF